MKTSTGVAVGTIGTAFTLANLNLVIGTLSGIATLTLVVWTLVSKIDSVLEKRRATKEAFRKAEQQFKEREAMLAKEKARDD